MEIKINREIREYKENMFFGLSLRQLVFFCAGLRCCRRYLFWSAECAGYGNGQLAVYPWCGSLCCHGLCKIPRHDGGKIRDRLGTLGISDPQAADLQAEEFIPRSHAGSARQSPKTTLTLETWVHFALSSKRHPTTPEGGKNAENTEKHPPQRYG